MFSESESEKEELNVNWFNQLFEQTKSDIQQSNEDFSTNETTSKNIVTTTAINIVVVVCDTTSWLR